ncbi:hypothetical protein PLICRDRAFT_150624 [Plicaturopsis crispa FD-325 SS-3]|nr:hypothetical protein PLICRDRAFT_150624 [Plicaturopsis crispa FD-325 SS-3]
MTVPFTLPPNLTGHIDVLMIDNFDSFTWNLYQQLSLLGARVTVIRNDAIPAHALRHLQITSLIVSPGPGHPQTDSGISRDAIKFFTGKVPILGVCMGLECLVDVFGGSISYAGEIMHGKTSRIRHDARGIFNNVPQLFESTRYHSLSASAATLPAVLQVTATSADSGVIMGVRHRTYTLESVQYHPESILSESGDATLRNFLSLRGGTWEENPSSRVLDVTLPPFPIQILDTEQRQSAAKIPSILEKIYAQRLKDVEVAKATPGTTPADLAALLAMHLAPPPVALLPRLKTHQGPALMAEIKRASPSKGAIALNANAAQQALTYALAGASVISVLTEPTWFKGSLLDMRLARQAIDALPHRPAVLRKDFILDEYQIAEARLHGADTVLLIVAMLPPKRLAALYAYSVSLGMEPLVEVNNAAEMERALGLGAKVIGVNNRNLHDFEVDMGTTSRLADMVREADVVLCALSGISAPADVAQYAAQGVGAVLVGEALMRAPDTRAFIRELLSWPTPPPTALPDDEPPLVKICGIRNGEEAAAATDAGADMLGLMFVPTSKRCISIDFAGRMAAALRSSRPLRTKPVAPFDAGRGDVPWFTAHARRLSATPTRPLLVGVFQDQPLSEILDAVATAQLDLVQLHGSEPVEWAKHIPVPVIRAFHVDAAGRGLEGLTRPGLNAFVLLDAVRPDGLSGGSGKVVDWELAKGVVDAGELFRGAGSSGETARMPIMLAGGLTPDNVREAVERVRPWAVDVSGGVETEDGSAKDIEKLQAFIRAVKGQ